MKIIQFLVILVLGGCATEFSMPEKPLETVEPPAFGQPQSPDEIIWMDLGDSSSKSVFLLLEDYPDDVLARQKKVEEEEAARLAEIARLKRERERKWRVGNVFRDRLKDGSLGPEMVVLPAGSFKMGDIQGGGVSDEKPVHRVSVGRFAMGKYEVTFAEYDKFAEATSRNKPSDGGWGRSNRPVINVSWNDAVAYTKWLSEQTGKRYRLPTESEWEYAARGGTETKYWWGNKIGKSRVNCGNSDCGDKFKYTSPIGSFAVNQFGLYDTVGNVWEWGCSEYESKYSGKEQRCAKNVNDNSYLVLRGGSWGDNARWSRSVVRFWRCPPDRSYDLGFRVSRL